MGSVTRSGKGWRAQVRLVGYSAEYKSFERNEKTKAWAWIHDRERDLKTQRRGEYPRHTVKEALESFREHEAPTHKGCRWEVVRTRKFETYGIAMKWLTEVTEDDAALWREARLKQVSKATVRREMVLWGQVFEYAKEKLRWIPKSVWREVKKPSIKTKKLPPPIPTTQIDKVVEQLGRAHKSREVALGFLLGCETAMRPWEMIPLEKQQVDYAGQVARLEDTKNGDDRDVPLSLAAVTILRELDAMNPESLTFFTVTEGSVTGMFGEARTAAGFPGMHFRHSRREGIRRLSKRLGILDLARAVGHRDLNSLMIYYQESASEMAKKLDSSQATPSPNPLSSAGAPPPKSDPAPENPDDKPP